MGIVNEALRCRATGVQRRKINFLLIFTILVLVSIIVYGMIILVFTKFGIIVSPNLEAYLLENISRSKFYKEIGQKLFGLS